MSFGVHAIEKLVSLSDQFDKIVKPWISFIFDSWNLNPLLVHFPVCGAVLLFFICYKVLYTYLQKRSAVTTVSKARKPLTPSILHAPAPDLTKLSFTAKLFAISWKVFKGFLYIGFVFFLQKAFLIFVKRLHNTTFSKHALEASFHVHLPDLAFKLSKFLSFCMGAVFSLLVFSYLESSLFVTLSTPSTPLFPALVFLFANRFLFYLIRRVIRNLWKIFSSTVLVVVSSFVFFLLVIAYPYFATSPPYSLLLSLHTSLRTWSTNKSSMFATALLTLFIAVLAYRPALTYFWDLLKIDLQYAGTYFLVFAPFSFPLPPWSSETCLSLSPFWTAFGESIFLLLIKLGEIASTQSFPKSP
jgi:hypothetical protein